MVHHCGRVEVDGVAGCRMVEVVVGVVVGLRWWSSMVTGVPWSLESVVTATSGVDALSGVGASPIVASAVDGAAMAAVECKM